MTSDLQNSNSTADRRIQPEDAPLSPQDEQDHSQEQSQDGEDTLELTIHHHGTPQTFSFHPSANITDLSDAIADTLAIPATHQKLMLTPRPGLLKPPFSDPDLLLSTLVPPTTKKITLMGSTPSEISSLNEQVTSSRARASRPRTVATAKPAHRRDWRKTQDEILYTFTELRPLPHLPRPERSLRFLARLRDDAGIKATMAKHHWSVPLLTEMDPAAHTTHESRTLGLNRNGGEVIELRLRTDAYDGYRDYKTIRKTLCHELTHNVFGEHDRHFWELCKQVEREVEQGDWRSGGRAVGEEEFYNPDDGGVGDEHVDGGGWTGGEYVLGGGGQQQRGGVSAGSSTLDRREVLARAAEERARRQQELARGPSGGSRGTEGNG
ncbi:MAG: hypothetical protein M4579_005389 [Chaenotheca gracillima]|nr:MAG: hypothetical protein M4579_005389 [Chaenotheca gracillima]